MSLSIRRQQELEHELAALEHDHEDAARQVTHRELLDKAVDVAKPHFVDDAHLRTEGVGQKGHRKVVREVTVPFKRKVKVPVTTKKIVTEMVEQKVPTIKLVKVPVTRTRTETYTVTEEQEAVRDKVIYVKKIVKEKYMKKVPVQKTRQVEYTDYEIQENTVYKTVQIPQERVVEEHGYRVDEVEDFKVVEVTELHEYELQPVATGHAVLHKTTDMGLAHEEVRVKYMSGLRSRRMGQEIHTTNLQLLDHIEHDDELQVPRLTTIKKRVKKKSAPPPAPTAEPLTPRPSTSQRRRTPRNMYETEYTSYISTSRPSTATRQRPSSARRHDPSASSAPSSPSRGFGSGDASQPVLGLLSMHDSDTDTRGVVVDEVSGPAQTGGVQRGDIITNINGRAVPSTSALADIVAPFTRQIHSSSRSPLRVTLQRRDGSRGNVTIAHY